MIQNYLRRFYVEIFGGLPIGPAIVAAAFLGIFCFTPSLNPSREEQSRVEPNRIAQRPEDRLVVKVERNESLGGLLTRHGLRALSARELLQKVRQFVDIQRLPKDQAISLILDGQDRNVRAVEFVLHDHIVRASATIGGWSVERQELSHSMRFNVVQVNPGDNFSKSLAGAGISAQQIRQLRTIFSSQIESSSELSAGDELTIVLPQKQYLDGNVVVGPLAAARWVISGRSYEAFGFSGVDGALRYYDSEGQSLPHSFLPAPLKYERISSTFNLARPDPVTGVTRPHQAIDYQAAVGTPVVAIGSGTVEFAGWREGYGLMIELKHAGGYASAYSHLSRLADGLTDGRRVKAGDKIGEVGRTGHATGPHLHFEFSLNGQRIDFLSVKVPEPDSLTGARLQQFRREQQQWLSVMSGSDEDQLARGEIRQWQ
jgi:murein DD-endopeptidase MepM/ murein hydrolase activator NlpD